MRHDDVDKEIDGWRRCQDGRCGAIEHKRFRFQLKKILAAYRKTFERYRTARTVPGPERYGYVICTYHFLLSPLTLSVDAVVITTMRIRNR